MSPSRDPNLILGPVELGVVFASILFGCAVVQTYVYYKKFPKDPWRIKALVCSNVCLVAVPEADLAALYQVASEM